MFKNFKIGKKLLLSSITIVVIFLAINVISFISLNSFVKQSDLEKHTSEVLIHLEHILTSLVDAETGQRGYVLTGEGRYLQPYDRGIALVAVEVDDVEKLTQDNQSQQQRIRELRRLIADKSEELQETIDLRSKGQFDAAVAIVLSDRGKVIMDSIRDVLDEMKDEEEELLSLRGEESRESQIVTQLVIVLGSLIAFVITVVIALILTNSIVESVTKARNAAIEIARGNMDIIVDTSGSDEIADLSRAIDTMRQNLKESFEDIKSRAKQLDIQLQETDEAKKATLNILEDVEEEKNNVAREKEKIDAILHSIGDAVFVVDVNHIITMFNQVAADISGYSAKEAIGKKYDTVLKFVLEETGKVNDVFIKESIKTGEVKDMANHTALVRKDGKHIPVADSAAPLKNPAGNVIGCVVVFRDVSKEREVDKAKTEFVSLASHQLRTPLSAINWYTEMLLGGDAGKLTATQKKYLQEVYAGSQRMVELVNSLLDVSRLELGTFAVEPEEIHIEEIAKSVMDELKPQVAEKKLIVKEEYEKNIPTILADPKLARMILQNLLSNAIKYTPEKGRVTLTLGVKKKDELIAGKKVLQDSISIAVFDTGYGIPKNEQNKIFTKLFRADNVKEKDTEGTGLGLYIIKSIVDHTGGTIWFESEENKGSTFYVLFPLRGMKKKEGTKKLGG